MGQMGSNAEFAADLLGWRPGRKQRLVPNMADTSNQASLAIAGTLLDEIGVPRGIATGIVDPKSGRPLERAVAKSLQRDLPHYDHGRAWHVHESPISIDKFVQYDHLKELDKLVRSSKELRVTLGRE